MKSHEEIQEDLDRVFQNILFQREEILNSLDWEEKQQRETVLKCLFMEGVNNAMMTVIEPLDRMKEILDEAERKGK
jgi:hypothetical protein